MGSAGLGFPSPCLCAPGAWDGRRLRPHGDRRPGGAWPPLHSVFQHLHNEAAALGLLFQNVFEEGSVSAAGAVAAAQGLGESPRAG